MFKSIDFSGSLNPTLNVPIYPINMKMEDSLLQIPESTSDSDCSFHSCMEDDREEEEEEQEEEEEKRESIVIQDKDNLLFRENITPDLSSESKRLAQQLKRLTLSTQSAPSTPGFDEQDRLATVSPLSVSPTDTTSFAAAQYSLPLRDSEMMGGVSRKLSHIPPARGSRSCRVSPNRHFRSAAAIPINSNAWFGAGVVAGAGGGGGMTTAGGSPCRYRSSSINVCGNRTYKEKSYRSRPCSLSGPSGLITSSNSTSGNSGGSNGRVSRGSVSKRRSCSGFSLSEMKSTLRDLSQTYEEDDYWTVVNTKSLSDMERV